MSLASPTKVRTNDYAGSFDETKRQSGAMAFIENTVDPNTGTVTATARKIAVLFYNAVRHGMEYVDPGASYYETRYRTRVVNNLHRRAKAFGFVLQPMERAPSVTVS